MTKINVLQSKARKTLRYLKSEGLLTDADELNIALLDALCSEWDNATSSTQKGAISKEIRACMEALPKPEAKTTDETEDFFKELENA